MKLLFCAPLLIFALGANGLQIGDYHLDARISAGHNNAQGTYGSIGADFYTFVKDHFAAGVGAYYAAGEHPSIDREIGAGPFVSYGYPLLDFLTASARQDIDYIDQKSPVLHNDGSYTSQSAYGMASITSIGLNLAFSRGFGVGVGYRFALSLNNSGLENNRSGLFFGLGLAI
jgi:hypothetical protein